MLWFYSFLSLLWYATGIAGIVYLLRRKGIKQWWLVVVIAVIALVDPFQLLHGYGGFLLSHLLNSVRNLILLASVATIVAGIVYLLRRKRIKRWWPVGVIAGIVLVTHFLPYVEPLSDIVVLLLLLAGVATGILSLKIKWLKWTLTIMIIAGAVLLAAFPPFTFIFFEEMSELLDCLFNRISEN